MVDAEVARELTKRPDPVKPFLWGITVGVGVLTLLWIFSQPSTPSFEDVREVCGGHERAAVIGDDGRSLYLDGKGEGDNALPIETMGCYLVGLDVPDSVIHRMEQTRALDGAQEAEWDGLHATWTFHPDEGLDIVIEQVQ